MIAIEQDDFTKTVYTDCETGHGTEFLVANEVPCRTHKANTPIAHGVMRNEAIVDDRWRFPDARCHR